MSRASGPRVAVVGLGTMGSMALWRLAARGAEVTGFERFGVGHDFGAAGGGTRMSRMVYAEGAHYLPLLRGSRLLWRELERAGGGAIMYRNGGLTIGPAGSPPIARSIEMARESGLAYEVLDPATVSALYPYHRELDAEEVAVFDPEAGVLRTDRAVLSAVGEARRLGAVVHENAVVEAVEPGAVVVDGRRLEFDEIVVCTGPWSNTILKRLGFEPETRRVRTSFHRPLDPALARPENFPSALRRLADGRSYGAMCSLDGNTVKFVIQNAESALPVPVDEVTHDLVNRGYLADVTDLVAAAMPGLHPYPVRVGAHPEGFTPDGEALVGRVPGLPGVLLMSGFSGHGFKMAPAFGELAATAVLDGDVSGIPSRLDPARLLPGAAASASADTVLAGLWFDVNASQL